MRRLALALLFTVALAGCESTQEKSAKLKARAKHLTLASTGLQITRTSTQVVVVATTIVRSSEGAAVAVTLRNRSARALHEVPIAVTVTDAGGHALYQNNAAGLEAALVAVPSLAPHQTLTWVDDQVPASGGPARASVRVGEAPSAGGALPAVSIASVTPTEDPSNGAGASASAENHSNVAQHSLVVFAIARRAGRIVAAGRAVLPELAAGGTAPVQVYFIGEAGRASLELVAAPRA